MRDVSDAPDDQSAWPVSPGYGASDPRLVRLDRLRASRGWSFPGPVGEFAAARVAGFEPVGQVFGTTVAFLGDPAFPYVGPPGLGRCFVVGSDGGGSSADQHNPLLATLREARELALSRAVAECEALGGDGVIGIRLSAAEFLSHTMEVTVEGTAVRARSLTRPPAPFTTHVSGQDLARLLDSGWMPFALVFGLALAARHFDDSMFQQTRLGVGAAGNREVSGYTRLVNDARREARRTLEIAVGERGGEGAVIGEATLRFSERECPRQFEQRSDYVAQAAILGSAVVSLERSTPATRRAPLTIMKLDRRAEAAADDAAGAADPSPAAPGLSARAFAYWSSRRSD
ncbi:heavy metal-binding domain-containing protein [Actinospica durhamensis]|uniref:Heavy metal-binding domain-containing protein n=1 Tax=Actinospica durhamensis TaxID=1508375 RepID=A0A941EZY2_9ACTN|nr:heavy metal-binding domain-containing protein [Actinospica durhamensis]MBR7838539.1 heavy metal-binding domain-containing protein [Actinospica durhamensis]